MKRSRISGIMFGALVVLITVLAVIPFVWTILLSFKDNSQIVNESGFQVAVTDKIGDKLDLGSATFNEEGFDKDLTITVNYNSVSTSTPVDV